MDKTLKRLLDVNLSHSHLNVFDVQLRFYTQN